MRGKLTQALFIKIASGHITRVVVSVFVTMQSVEGRTRWLIQFC